MQHSEAQDARPIDRLMGAIARRDRGAVDAMLAITPGLLDQRSDKGVSPIAMAAYVGDSELAAALAALKAAPDFFECCIVGDEPAVNTQLARGQEVDERAPDGFTPLGLAAFFGRPAIVQCLLTAGANVNAQACNAQRVAPLHAAVARGDARLAGTLLLHGADPNLPQQLGIRPLHAAAAHDRLDLAALLWVFGADARITDDNGHDAERHARQHGHAALADLLARWAASPPPA